MLKSCFLAVVFLAGIVTKLSPIFGPTPEPSPTPTPFNAQPGPTPPPAPPFSYDDVNPYHNGGTGVVVGRIAIPTKLRGSLQFGGVQVHLVPDVPYGRWVVEWYHAYSFDRTNVDSDASFFDFTSYGRTDPQGYFRIENVTPGKYLVYAEPYFATYNGAHASATSAPAIDETGDNVTTEIPIMKYEHAKSENFFLSGAVTVANDRETTATFSVAEDLVSTTDPIPPDAFDMASPPPIHATQLRSYAQSGTSTVSGRLFVRLQGASRNNYYGGFGVYLWPALPYMAWLLDRQERSWRSAGHEQPIKELADQRFIAAVRYAKTDKNGYFRFDNLPALPFVVHIEMDLLRQHYVHDHATDYTPTDEYGNQTGPHLHHDDESRNYTCDRKGLLAGIAQPTAGHEVVVPLSLLVTSIDDGIDCRMFHND